MLDDEVQSEDHVQLVEEYLHRLGLADYEGLGFFEAEEVEDAVVEERVEEDQKPLLGSPGVYLL